MRRIALPDSGTFNAPTMRMKSLRPILLALTAAATLSVAYPAKANLITNPGFETGNLTGWQQNFNPFVGGNLDGIAPHSGNYQVFGGGGIVPANISQTLATMAGQSYTVDLWAAGSINSGFGVLWNGSFVFSHTFTQAAGYTEFTFNVTASSASTQIGFTLPRGIVMDDISVNPTTVPDGGTTVSLLGCALLGLAGLRRKLGW